MTRQDFMKIIDGKKIANKILTGLKKEITAKKLNLCLVVVLVGDDPASHLYVKLKEKKAKEIGIKIEKYLLDKNSSEEEIINIIKKLNKDKKINGILVQMPLPRTTGMRGKPDKISPNKIINIIHPKKDIDGFLEDSPYNSPFILSIWQAIESTKINLKNKKIIALVNSEIFGEALKNFFKNKNLNINYFLNISNTKNADIIITTLGKPNIIKNKMIKKGAVLIDGGISKIGEWIVGDIDAKSVSQKANYLSPVPGGLGPLTIAFLLKNIVRANMMK